MTGKLKAFGSTVMGTQGGDGLSGAAGGDGCLRSQARTGGGKVSVSKVGVRVFVQHFLEFFFVCDGWGEVGHTNTLR